MIGEDSDTFDRVSDDWMPSSSAPRFYTYDGYEWIDALEDPAAWIADY